MELWLTLAIGVLFATGTYLVLRRSLLKVVIGFSLISHGTNLLLLTTGKLKRGQVPILLEGYQGLYTDPLPQALILTAIVIGFAVQGFLLTLLVVTWRRGGTLDLKELAAELPAGAAEPEAAPESAGATAASPEPGERAVAAGR